MKTQMLKTQIWGLCVIFFFLCGCKSDHAIKLTVKNETPKRTQISLQPEQTSLILGNQDIPLEQLQVLSWMVLQQNLYNDYAIRLAHQRQLEQSDRAFLGWIVGLVGGILGILGGWLLYLQYRIKTKNK